MSTEPTNELIQAFAKAQAEFPVVQARREASIKGRTASGSSYEYKYVYANEADIVDAIRPILAKNGLGFAFNIKGEGNHILCDCIVSGHGGMMVFGGSMVPLPTKPSPTEYGIVMTYARRYALRSLGVAVDKEDDENLINRRSGSAPKESEAPKPVGGSPAELASGFIKTATSKADLKRYAKRVKELSKEGKINEQEIADLDAQITAREKELDAQQQ